jgi:hypothetical protein
VGLDQGPLSLASTTDELIGRNSSGSGLESREYGRRDSSRWPRGTLYPQKSWHNSAYSHIFIFALQCCSKLMKPKKTSPDICHSRSYSHNTVLQRWLKTMKSSNIGLP